MTLKKINWDNIPDEEFTPGMKRCIITAKKLMVARMSFKDGFLVPLHSHVHEQVTQYVSGKMQCWFGDKKDQVMDLGPGDVIVIPGTVRHEILMIGDVEEVDTWSPPRQDWLDGTESYLKTNKQQGGVRKVGT